MLPLTLNMPIVHVEQRGAKRPSCGGVRAQARNTKGSATGGRGVVQLRQQLLLRGQRRVRQGAGERAADHRARAVADLLEDHRAQL